MDIKEVEKKILDTCIRIGKIGGGALIILGGNPAYVPLVEQKRKFTIDDDLFELYSKEDGAMLVDERGNVNSYRVKILNQDKIVENKGTRHAAAASASLSGSTVFLVSQEDRKIKIFKSGEIVIQIDVLEKGIEKRSSEITEFLESAGVGVLGAWGSSLFGVVIGVTIWPGVIIFGGTYWLIKKILNKNETK